MNPIWTVEECVFMGGHCWEEDDAVFLTNPPIYHRRCKHCCLVEEGREQPGFTWHEDSHQPWAQHAKDGPE